MIGLQIHPITLFLATIGIAIFIILRVHQWIKLKEMPVLPPVVRKQSPCSFSSNLRLKPSEFLKECQIKYGDVFTLEMDGGKNMTYVFDPNNFKQILTTFDFFTISKQSKQRFKLNKILEYLPRITTELKKSLSSKILNPALHRFQKHFDSTVKDMQTPSEYTSGVNIGLLEFVETFIVPKLLYTLFGPSIYYKGFSDDFRTFNKAMATRNTGSDGKLASFGEKAEENLRNAVCTMLKDQTPTDFVKSVQEGALRSLVLDEEELTNFFLMLLWASLINLRPTTFWMIAHIAREPNALQTIKEEAETASEELDIFQIRNMKKTWSIINEVFRVQSRPNMYRYSLKDTVIKVKGGTTFLIPKGNWVALFPKLMHMDKNVYKDAHKFKYNRFPVDTTLSSVYRTPLVFGMGMGMCPAQDYTYFILAIIAIKVFSTFNIDLVGDLPTADENTVASTPPPLNDVTAIIKLKPLVRNDYQNK